MGARTVPQLLEALVLLLILTTGLIGSGSLLLKENIAQKTKEKSDDL